MEANKLWDHVWQFAMDHFIFHTAIVTAIIVILFGNKLKRFTKIKIGKGGLELDEGDKVMPVDPKLPCPYIESKQRTYDMINKTNESVRQISDTVKDLSGKIEQILKDVEQLRLDQQKQLFRSQSQPKEDRLVAGLKCVSFGENGTLKKAVQSMAKEHFDMYEAIVALRPDLRINGIE